MQVRTSERIMQIWVPRGFLRQIWVPSDQTLLLVRGAVVPGLDTWWAPLHRLRQLFRVDLFDLTTASGV